MSDSHSLRKENMLRALPDVLRNDKSMRAIVEGLAAVLEKCAEDTDRLLIYPDIGRLPEGLLDILAYDFKVDWWDHGYTLESKRRTLRDSWAVHRRLGTRWAVKTAIAAIYTDVQISEWFEYGGKPYHFRLTIGDANRQITPERHIKLLQLTEYYKNLRSRPDIIEYRSVHDPVESGVFICGAATACSRRTLAHTEPDRRASDIIYAAGASGKCSRNTLLEAQPNRSVSDAVYAAGTSDVSSQNTLREAAPDRRVSASVWMGGMSGADSRVRPSEPERKQTASIYPAAGHAGVSRSKIREVYL